MKDLPLSELRPMLQTAKEHFDTMIEPMGEYIKSHTLALTAYDRAFSRAKVKEFARATKSCDKVPTIINALAEIDPDVIIAKDALDLAYAKLEAMKVELKAAEVDIDAIKKQIGSIETEMRTFKG